MADGPYSRFYWCFMDEFEAIYDDKQALGWWMTLLVMAEGAHPAAPQLPRSIPAKIVDRLAAVGLIELGNADRFRVKGVNEERNKRSEAARVAGLASGRLRIRSTDCSTTRSTETEPSKAKQSKDEQSIRGSSAPKPLAEIIPDVAQMLGRGTSHD